MPDAAETAAIVIEPCRPVEADARLIMQWRNDPTTQAMFFRPGLKVWPDFFHEFVENYFGDRKLPPVFARRGSETVAFVVFKRVPDPQQADRRCVDISINVVPSQRGSGVGTAVLREIRAFLAGRDVDTILAVIRQSNAASLRAFEKAGFRLLDRTIHQVLETHEFCAVCRYVADVV